MNIQSDSRYYIFFQMLLQRLKTIVYGDSSFSIIPLHKDNVLNTTVYMRPHIGMNTNHTL